MNVRHIEGVPYYRHVIHFRLRNGRRRRRMFWSPGHPWVRSEVARYLDELVGVENIKERSITIREASDHVRL